jgi:hypothetical protein
MLLAEVAAELARMRSYKDPAYETFPLPPPPFVDFEWADNL